MAIYGAVRLDKLQAVYSGNISSVKSALEVDNGRVVVAGSLVSGQRELYNAATPTAVATDEILLVASPEVTYEAGAGILDFTNKAGKPARAYHLTVGDIVTVTDVNIDGTSVVDQYLIPVNGSDKLAPSATLGTTRFVAKVISKGTLYGQAATVYKVVKV
ncbi:hypothetical protein IFU39_16835 [Paenibacillus sp. CFBP 13594]|uniref:hypothetical protein n=1 Tax=Paenibacillus sp. CFBP 13594 TaxID=2774037 RepID=UPI00177DF5F0|nr:hypothetical protein [Paenibacillus sp. CFBP 13594]MBD8839480.1 hypothetical protein [Paenibacillus sp. CFBP 13594]